MKLKCISNEWLGSFVGAYCLNCESEKEHFSTSVYSAKLLSPVLVYTPVCVSEWVYFTLQHFSYSLPCKGSPWQNHPCPFSHQRPHCAPCPRQHLTHDWRQQVPLSLEAVSNQGSTIWYRRGETDEQCLFCDRKQNCFSFFLFSPTIKVFAYKWQPRWLSRKRWSWGKRDEWQIKMKCHESKVQARWGEIEPFYLLVRNGEEGGR